MSPSESVRLPSSRTLYQTPPPKIDATSCTAGAQGPHGTERLHAVLQLDQPTIRRMLACRACFVISTSRMRDTWAKVILHVPLLFFASSLQAACPAGRHGAERSITSPESSRLRATTDTAQQTHQLRAMGTLLCRSHCGCLDPLHGALEPGQGLQFGE
jgi:hypothetical protein